MRHSIRLLFHQIGDGPPQFHGKGLRNLTLFKVFTHLHRLLQGAQTDLTGFARFDMRFDLLAGGGVQLFIDILGKPVEQRNAVVVGMMCVSPFHNTFSMLL